eukprot:TRINITY_DN7200_c1_g1_i1.p1 TRINITY_DN7200_c1_g1~~TRINITY_DN7200_c1_g1_i1.p1  ORF type:complete len:290 (+),score=18.64 TRINITY_DN7200_c1_g1_i1:119-988(+)
MTSALKLFYTRRSRTPRDTELGSGSLDDQNHHHHHHRRHHHHHHHHHRRDEDSDPLRRSYGSSHARHLCHRVSQTERESVQQDHSTTQSGTSNSIRMEASSRTNRPRFTANDRLPGAVLAARARLLERLRGVSLTGNRQSSTDPGISWDEFAVSDDFRPVDAGDWETETPIEWLIVGSPFTDPTLQADQFSSLQDSSKEKKPIGLGLEAVNCLQREVFSIMGKGDRDSDCCICLESFQEGDGLICLPCGHRFHPYCLDPWVQTRGDCPYCRAAIAVDYGEENCDRRILE